VDDEEKKKGEEVPNRHLTKETEREKGKGRPIKRQTTVNQQIAEGKEGGKRSVVAKTYREKRK